MDAPSSIRQIALMFCLLACPFTLGCERLTGSLSRCPDELLPVGARCCAPGQTVTAGRCGGKPLRCPAGFRISEQGRLGCVANNVARRVDGGAVVVGPNDWESEQVKAERFDVATFWLDSTEVTWERFWQCVAAEQCALRTDAKGAFEPGLPVTQIPPSEAQRYCAWVAGRLPRRAEWLRAAAGATSRRFPWGQTGLVCRRASYGLTRGPCAEGGLLPDWAGARPDGKSADGLLDLVGNVAELVESEAGTFEVRGGSFRAEHAARLKSWTVEPYRAPRDDIGFRCAYDAEPWGR